MSYRNNEELVYSRWLDELVKQGFVESYLYEPFSIVVVDKAEVTKAHKLRELSYTPDFVITWTDKALDVFIVRVGSQDKRSYMHVVDLNTDNKLVSYVDIKGTFVNSRNVSGVTFPIIQKVLWFTKGLYINKIKPLDEKGLFHNTFTPVDYMYLKGRKVKTLRKTKFKIRSLDSFLKEINHDSTSQ